MRKLFVPALALLVLTYAMLAQAQRGGGPPDDATGAGIAAISKLREGGRGRVLRDIDRLDHDRQQRGRGRERRRRAHRRSRRDRRCGHRVDRRRQNAHEQADQVRGRLALSLRSRIRQSGLRSRRHHHRPRHRSAAPQRTRGAQAADLPDEQHGLDREHASRS